MASDLPAALNLTTKQAEFARLYVELGDAAKAAAGAGYGSSAIAAYRLVKHPAILALVRYETAKRLQGLAPVALTVLQEIMLDQTVSAKTRADCAVKILDRSGHSASVTIKAADRPNGSDKPHAELTESELLDMLQNLRKEQAEEAQLVQTEAEIQGFAPDNAPKVDKRIDPFE
jgi:phage terminase small subunit